MWGPHIACWKPLQQTCIRFSQINAFPVGVNGVKPDFKVVSACLDTQEEDQIWNTKSFTSRWVCVWMQLDRKLISIEILGQFGGGGGVTRSFHRCKQVWLFTPPSFSLCLTLFFLCLSFLLRLVIGREREVFPSFLPSFLSSHSSSLLPSVCLSFHPSVLPSLVFLTHMKSRLCHRWRWRWRWLWGWRQQWSVGGGVARRGRGGCELGLHRRRQQWWWRWRWWWCWRLGAGLSQRSAAKSVAAGAALEQLQAVVPLPAVSRANLPLPQHRLADACPEVTGAAQTVRTVWGAQTGIPDLTWKHRDNNC